ncbi:MAG: rane protein [Marmoricola sp.]|jgi:sortase A|nr:rane protein [Marmoricola sp.]
MIAAGLAMLGWVGWQFWGTNWVAHRDQAKVTETLQRQWTSGSVRLAPKHVPTGRASALVRIPKFGRQYVVPVLEGVSDDVLATGFGHFSRSADPGQVGNYALAAHRVTHGEPLRHLPGLRPGDRVIVETVDTTYVYRLDTDPRKLVIPFTGVWVLAPVPRNPEAGGVQPAQTQGQRLITLTTCSEIFHTDNRMIAFGHLVSSTRKT